MPLYATFWGSARVSTEGLNARETMCVVRGRRVILAIVTEAWSEWPRLRCTTLSPDVAGTSKQASALGVALVRSHKCAFSCALTQAVLIMVD